MVVVSTNSPSSLCTSLSQFIILVPFEFILRDIVSSLVNIVKCIQVEVFDEIEAAIFTLFDKDAKRLIDHNYLNKGTTHKRHPN
jgi:hypothetical protein